VDRFLATNTNPIQKRLKQARIAAGLSQKGLGIAAGIDEFSASARMNQYETGKHVPDYLTLKHISSVLERPVAYFYADDDTLAEIILLYHLMSKSNKKKLLDMAKKS
jgi:transcriptional regulator with XRE-family HTH domain